MYTSKYSKLQTKNINVMNATELFLNQIGKFNEAALVLIL